MRNPFISLLLLILLTGCFGDEGLTGYAPGQWRLVQAGPQATNTPRQHITLDLSSRGRISGQGPCNTYSATQTAPYPWFEPGPIASTRAACPDLAAERAYLAALSRMQLAEVSGPVLILSNEAGETLEYRLVAQ